ncbi:hypothetical protein CWS72_24095 [Telmatospirillum siberiense]|uniref:Uncharacterized protein n=1 Tax=Telmatospirillum siberiense TaxID=382514 RepID=A0A2N3PNL3_9PROT|nr:hypothetical protein CWS72_24095 [Telmatospirillum siberiense]
MKAWLLPPLALRTLLAGGQIPMSSLPESVLKEVFGLPGVANEIQGRTIASTPQIQAALLADLHPELVSTPRNPVRKPRVPPSSTWDAKAYETINTRPPPFFDPVSAAIEDKWVDMLFSAILRGEKIPEANMQRLRSNPRYLRLVEQSDSATLSSAKQQLSGVLGSLGKFGPDNLSDAEKKTLVDTTRLLSQMAERDGSKWAMQAITLAEAMRGLLEKFDIIEPRQPLAEDSNEGYEPPRP